MLVSAIIPTFNRETRVARAVESVLAQTHADLECIVVDDGSTDNTPEVLAKLAVADPRVRLLRQENAGVSSARNAGMAMSRGEYVALLDSDDEWLPRKLELQLAWMGEKGWQVSHTEEIWIRKGRRVNPGRKHAKPSGRFFERALSMCLVSPSCSLFSRECLRVVGDFDTELRACEDYDFWLRTLLRFDIGLVPEALTIRHGGRADQLSIHMVGQDLFRIRSLCKLLSRDDLEQGHRALIREKLSEKGDIYVQGCVKRGRVEEALRIREMVRQTMV